MFVKIALNSWKCLDSNHSVGLGNKQYPIYIFFIDSDDKLWTFFTQYG